MVATEIEKLLALVPLSPARNRQIQGTGRWGLISTATVPLLSWILTGSTCQSFQLAYMAHLCPFFRTQVQYPLLQEPSSSARLG